MKKYELNRHYDDVHCDEETVKDREYIMNEVAEHDDTCRDIAVFDTREEALIELKKYKNTACLKQGYIDTYAEVEYFDVVEWDCDEETGEFEKGQVIAYAEWDE